MKKIVFYLLALPMIVGFMSSCTGTKTDARKVEGRWLISEVDGDKVTTERPAFMEFNLQDMRLHGNAGCNTFNSSVKFDTKDESKIMLTPAVSTMMACPDMETENKIMKAIESVAKVKTNNNSNQLLLTNEAGKVLFVLTKN